ncbi:MAG: hypothetical protein KME04_00720 [Pleurocapsa minor GSE-CHR-MK-17-07R]|nr:hypothetical protein [Pleurocapsa minor GSE-CHR-MK 17-07R]
MADVDPRVFSEIFPLRSEALGALTAYRLLLEETSPGGSASLERRLGGKLAYRLNGLLDGSWVWAGGRILTNKPANPFKLAAALDDARTANPLFAPIHALEEDFAWAPSAEVLADYAVRGPINALENTIMEALHAAGVAIPNAHIVREFRARGWVVDNQPAVSLSVTSRLIDDRDLAEYAASLDRVTDLVGYGVIDITSSMQGEILKVIGQVSEHRDRLLALTQRDEMAQLIVDAPDDTWVFRVLSGSNEYDYVASALCLIIRLDDAHRFGVDPALAERALHVKLSQRAQMVKLVSDILKSHQLIGDAFSSSNAPHLFGSAVPYDRLRFGSKSRDGALDKLTTQFADAGMYAWPEAAGDGERELRVSLINALPEDVDDFIEAMRRMMDKQFDTTLEIVRERRLRVASQANLESAVRLLSRESSDLMLVFLPDGAGAGGEEAVSDVFTKAQTIGRGQACCIVHASQMHHPELMTDIVMGLFARAGAVPYVLESPVSYADRIVGLSVVRNQRKDSTEISAIARIYEADGRLMGLKMHTVSLKPDDALPDSLFDAALPAEWLEGKEIVLHHEGRIPRDLLRALGSWEAACDATLHIVEVSTMDVPRMYALGSRTIEQPIWGTRFRMNEEQALLVTGTAYAETGPMPLLVVSEPGFSIEDAVHSVMSFMYFHYTTLNRPRLPVTLHHAEIISASVLRGVLPALEDVSTPFWL